VYRTKDFEHRIRVKREDVEMVIDSLRIKNIVAAYKSGKSRCSLCNKYEHRVNKKNGFSCFGCPLDIVDSIPNPNNPNRNIDVFVCLHVKGSLSYEITKAVREFDAFTYTKYNGTGGEADGSQVKAIRDLSNLRKKLYRALKHPGRNRKY